MMKARLKGAQKGHSLLKKKSDALTLRFRQILKKIVEVGCDQSSDDFCLSKYICEEIGHCSILYLFVSDSLTKICG